MSERCRSRTTEPRYGAEGRAEHAGEERRVLIGGRPSLSRVDPVPRLTAARRSDVSLGKCRPNCLRLDVTISLSTGLCAHRRLHGTDECTAVGGNLMVARVTTLKAAAGAVPGLVDYYDGLAKDRATRG